MTKSKILLYFCLSFIIGISFAVFCQISQLLILGFLIFNLILISVFWKYKKMTVLSFCLLFLVLGAWHYQSFQSKIKNNELKNYINQEIAFIGIIDGQPVKKENTTKFEVQPQKVKGRILITTFKYPEYKYGDKLKISGKLEKPLSFNDFDYEKYLEKQGVYAVMSFPEIELLDKGFGNPVIKILVFLKNELKQGLNKIITLPQSALLEGLLFGDEESFSKEWREKFNLTGTRHITAVSGMNITILSALVLNFLLAFGFWRHQAFYLSIILIVFYILMIGLPASGIRAGIMAIIFLTAQYFGRASNASRLIIFSAVLMLFFNPFLITDIGFQLSFLAVMGLVYLQPFFMNLLKKAPEIFELRYSLASTLSAQIFTFPVLIYNFGQISLISPLINILIIPLLPIITILGFAISFLAIFSQGLGLIFSFPVWLILTYILKIIDFSAKISHTTLIFENVSWIWVLVSYLILGLLVCQLEKKQKPRFLE